MQHYRVPVRVEGLFFLAIRGDRWADAVVEAVPEVPHDEARFADSVVADRDDPDDFSVLVPDAVAIRQHQDDLCRKRSEVIRDWSDTED